MYFVLLGWNVWPTPLMEQRVMVLPWPEHGPRRNYGIILFAARGDRKVLRVAPDVITCPPRH